MLCSVSAKYKDDELLKQSLYIWIFLVDSYADGNACQSSICFSTSELSSFTKYSSTLAISANRCISIEASSNSNVRRNRALDRN